MYATRESLFLFMLNISQEHESPPLPPFFRYNIKFSSSDRVIFMLAFFHYL